jgi:TetR/AcrR family transcriptional regulator, transcriptional repressor of bet genes
MKKPKPVRRASVDALARSRAERGPRFSRETPEVRKRLIVEAAIKCLDQGGAANLTISSIMGEAGVSRGLVNHYFPSMSALLVEAYKSMLDGLATSAMTDMKRRSPGPAMDLKAMIEVACSPLIFEKPRNQAWLEMWALMPAQPDLRKLHTTIYRAYHRELVGAIERLAAERGNKVNAARLAVSAIALVDGLWLNWSVDSRFVSAEEAKRAVYDLFEARLGPL